MGEGNDTPKLQPPPRVPAAGGPESDAGKRGPGSPKRRVVLAAVYTAMVLGLIGVFVLLPRWQENRQDPTSESEGHEASPAPVIEEVATPEPTPTAQPIAVEPSPVPAPTDTPRPRGTRPGRSPERQPSTEDRRYVDAMSEGLAALENRQWQVAHDAFERASRVRPGAREVADGLARAEAGRRRELVAASLRRAHELEQSEDWRGAEKAYSSVLAVDPESATAIEGQRRTDTRATLDAKLEFHLANPGRLTTPAVFSDATSALDQALETVPSGPRLESQIARLESLMKRASTPVAVVLESDALTEVMVYRVGRLGTFTRHELKLKPGAYTVVGSRTGYRDVRLQLVVNPGTSPEPLVVRCTEGL